MTEFKAQTPPRKSATFDDFTLAEIRRAAATGIYDIRGAGTKRKVPNFDDLLFLGASMSRYPLEGYRERCETSVVLGTRHAKKPIELKIPITIAGMSFGALSGNAKEALGRGARSAGTSTTTGDGGMTDEERVHSDKLVYQYLPSRYGMNPRDLRRADAIEIVVGQGAKPGGGGMLLGQKISDRVAAMRDLPVGIDQRSACRHPDWTGPDDLEIKIMELREITNWEKPIYVKVGGARPYYDTALAVKAGADVVVLDGMQGGTAATQDVFIENVGMPTLACLRPAVQALQDLGMHRKVQLVISGGIRSGADVAKALALGADAVSIGTAALVAIGDNDPRWEEEYQKLGTTAGAYDDWHEGQDPAGVTTQNPELAKRLDPVLAGRRLANYLKVMTLEAQTIARACGHNRLHNLEPEDLCALTMEAAAMARVPLAGTDWYPGKKFVLTYRRLGLLEAAFFAYRGARTPDDGDQVTEDLAKFAAERGIKYFMISYTDLFGGQRAKLVPAQAIADMQKDGAGFAGFATWLDLSPAHPDLFAIPDASSVIQLPWKKDVAWVAADCMIDDNPLGHAPRIVLKNLIEQAESMKLRVKTGVEPEFFLISPDGSKISDEFDTAEKPCYDQQALMRRYDVIAEICDAMLELGWRPYQNDHEDANGQFEMNWEYDDSLKTADKHSFFKFMVKSIAEKHGLRATFMPKPFKGLTGNGCHCHISVWDLDGKSNAFADKAMPFGLSAKGRTFLGGIMKHASALAAVTNPTVNSYKRINAPRTLSGATWAPNTVTWTGNNRTHMVRVPAPGRFELRLADGAVNPYLLQAVVIAAGLNGLRTNADPGPHYDIDMYRDGHTVKDAPKLPLNLLDALRAFESDKDLQNSLGSDFSSAYTKLKYDEWNAYASHFTSWERETTIDI